MPVPKWQFCTRLSCMYPKNAITPHDRPVLKKFINIFVVNVSHLSGEIFTFNKLIFTGK